MTYPNFPYPETMTIVKRSVTSTDDYGNDVLSDTSTVISQCVYTPGGSNENVVFTDQVNTTDAFYVPEGTDVTALDAIQYKGDTYEVSGAPSHWRSPFSGRVSPVRVSVIRVTGGAS
jgi:hypothetical protein